MAAVLYLPNRDGVGAAEVNANSYPERDSILFGVSTIGSDDDGIVLWTIEFENEPPAKRQSRRITKTPPPNKIQNGNNRHSWKKKMQWVFTCC
jgi:hypothetical protein